MEEQENKDFHRSESHRYWANAIGFTALCLLLMFVAKSCNETVINRDALDSQTQCLLTNKSQRWKQNIFLLRISTKQVRQE